ncbi:hypothetical protein NDU88_004292, partial [Pleurodeles waltl]
LRDFIKKLQREIATLRSQVSLLQEQVGKLSVSGFLIVSKSSHDHAQKGFSFNESTQISKVTGPLVESAGQGI